MRAPRRLRTGALAAAVAGALGLAACGGSSGMATTSTPPPPLRTSARDAPAVIRVNQVGYATGDRMPAVLMTAQPANGATARVVDASGATVMSPAVGPDRGGWNARYRHIYPIDMSRLGPGTGYRVVVSGAASASSPAFRVGTPADVYGPLAAAGLRFFAAQHDGANVDPSVLNRQPAHLNDRNAREYRPPTYRGGVLVPPLQPLGTMRDVSGGWYDAGDYMKFVSTTSFADMMLLYSALQPSPQSAALAAEARFGTDWLLKMWDQSSGSLDYQVGIGDGVPPRILGDHDLWRLPQRDDGLPAGPHASTRYLAHRPALRAPGPTISPNLAGRLGAAFALCSQVFWRTDPPYADRCLRAGEAVLARARTRNVGTLLTTTPHAYYPETTWRDDLALGLTEMARALRERTPPPGLPHPTSFYYLKLAAQQANALLASPQADVDSFGVYDVTAMVDYELFRLLPNDAAGRHPGVRWHLPERRVDLLHDLADQLRLAERLGRRNAFGLANPSTPSDDVSHALGYQIMARWNQLMTGRPRFAGLATSQRDWVLGENAWGTSFVAGTGTTFPLCVQHQVANLAGSLTGGTNVLTGAPVSGPGGTADVRGSLSTFATTRRCPVAAGDPMRAFNPPGQLYLDNVRSVTTEPSIDLGALAVTTFTLEAGAPAH